MGKNFQNRRDFLKAAAMSISFTGLCGCSEGMQSFAFNVRREKFADARVRQALNFAFDFEWANENLFFGQYVRTNSYFSNSELAATGTPGEAELVFLLLDAAASDAGRRRLYRSPLNPQACSPT